MIIDGKSVRGRKNRWGVVNVEDANHCEFVHLRNFLTRFVGFSLGFINMLTEIQDTLARLDRDDGTDPL